MDDLPPGVVMRPVPKLLWAILSCLVSNSTVINFLDIIIDASLQTTDCPCHVSMFSILFLYDD